MLATYSSAVFFAPPVVDSAVAAVAFDVKMVCFA